MNKEQLKRRIAVAAGLEPADTVIKNGRIIDVFNGEIIEGDVALADGYFAGIGSYEGIQVIDAEGLFICPGFIDGHVHIESSMVTPEEFAKAVLPHGVTTVIADPHEIANVLGTEGIRYMLDASEGLPLDILIMLPSSVPAADFEHSGAVLNSGDLLPFLDHPRVLGLAEVMNFPAVKYTDDSMLEKIQNTLQAGKRIDGHAAGFLPEDINIYMAANIRSDHEGTSAEDAKMRLQRGMYVMIREGTAAKDLKSMIGAVTSRNSRRCFFVTDDKHLDDLIEEGSIDHNARLAVSCGLDPITAVLMASLNAAEYFGLHDKGAIAPGYRADFILLEDLPSMTIKHVFKDGRPVAKDGHLTPFPVRNTSEPILPTVHYPDELDLQLAIGSNKANMIEIVPNSLMTLHKVAEAGTDQEGNFLPSIERDFLKLALIERHRNTGLIGLGIVHGLGLKAGAIGSTVAHDSHNLIIAGTNDEDIQLAAQEIKRMQGGLIAVKNGEILARIELPIAGLMSASSYKDVYHKLKELDLALDEMGAAKSFDPFLCLSFLALPVIPKLKLTVHGLFDAAVFKLIGTAAEKHPNGSSPSIL
ncbi:adenine deaminase [Peribacillus kribbensis]|uniref:adenine deaminase n=1 Tax=Peribacillus kribbensis TaxID=356658 RepID=UPI0004051B07|nr:adenine deaminase [Peribacillus kribbensis]